MVFTRQVCHNTDLITVSQIAAHYVIHWAGFYFEVDCEVFDDELLFASRVFFWLFFSRNDASHAADLHGSLLQRRPFRQAASSECIQVWSWWCVPAVSCLINLQRKHLALLSLAGCSGWPQAWTAQVRLWTTTPPCPTSGGRTPWR